MTKLTLNLVGAIALLAFTSLTPVHAAVDAAAAQALFKDNECTKCHAVDKDKKGPSLQKIAAKYKGKADGQAKAIDIDHKVLDSKDPAVQKNLADWILSQ
jgi:cytochrome c